MTTVLCPGSFDPPTNGHLDVIARAADLFDRVVVGVIRNPSKDPLFTVDERVGLLEKSLGSRAGIECEGFEGLLVDFARMKGADAIVKGLRTSGDFDYEVQMAQMNSSLSGIETVFLATDPRWGFLSSSLVREVARLGGDVAALVPAVVATAVKERLA